MDKEILTALAGDEAVALASVEAIDGTRNEIGPGTRLLGKKLVSAGPPVAPESVLQTTRARRARAEVLRLPVRSWAT